MGNCASSTNRHLKSWIGTIFPLWLAPAPELLDPPIDPDPPLDSVYELGSSMDRTGVCVDGLLDIELGGKAGAGALGAEGGGEPGGGGGGAEGDGRPNALRAACSAIDACPFVEALGAGGLEAAFVYL